MNWDDLRIFNAVVLRGGLGGGAKAAGVAEPTARRRLRALEDRLGVALTRRTVSGLAPTPVGVAVSSPVRAMAARAAAGSGMWADSDTDPMAGLARILVDERLTLGPILPLIAQWADSYPRLVVDLMVSSTPDQAPDPMVDIVVSLANLGRHFENARIVAYLTRGLFASRDYLAAIGPPRGVAEVRGQELIGAGEESNNLSILRAFNSRVDPRDIGFRTDSWMARRAAIRAGVGIGIDFVELVHDPDFVRVLPHLGSHVPVWTAFLRTDRAGERARRLRASIDAALANLSAVAIPAAATPPDVDGGAA